MRSALILGPIALFSWTVLLAASCKDGGTTSGTGGGAPAGCERDGASCEGLCDDDLGCVECLNDVDCGASSPYCHLGHCDPCDSAADCEPGKACMPADHRCGDACTSDTDCDGDAPTCDPASGACVGCTASTECPSEAPFCEPTTLQCSACLTDADCGGASPKCELDERRCVGCAVDSDCKDGAVCREGACVGCEKDEDCPTETPKCEEHTCVAAG